MNLTEAITRIEGLLQDSSNARFSDTDITNGVRLALSEVSLGAGDVLFLEGLDGALTTTVPAHVERVLVQGGAGYTAIARAGARSDWELQDAGEFAKLRQWGEDRLKDFRALIRQAYPAETTRVHDQRESAAPFGSWGDSFGEVGKDQLK